MKRCIEIISELLVNEVTEHFDIEYGRVDWSRLGSLLLNNEVNVSLSVPECPVAIVDPFVFQFDVDHAVEPLIQAD